MREGFDHLFYNLVTGPQTSEMQANGYLAPSRVFAPTPDDRIRGGEVGQTGDFTEGGIAKANDDGDNGHFIMTTLAVNFWQNTAAGRQTVAYAVSKGHAANLVREFTNKRIPAAAILSDTSSDDREKAITDFRNGNLTVLVNVAVATEGFDLPDASCVMITRPTKSLALYLQMVGRGLRPKDDGGDCLILDLAGNAEEHGLPEDYREWSLTKRGDPSPGEAPVHYCYNCHREAHPAHHKCPECGADLGKPCSRCGKFRPWSRWAREGDCPIPHESVCDYCHDDAHSAIGAGRYDSKQGSEFYSKRADENRKEGNLEAALWDYFAAINIEKTRQTDDFQLALLHIQRAQIYFEIDSDNIELAESDFEEAIKIAHGFRENHIDFYYILPMGAVYEVGRKMYQELGWDDKAELASQKAQEMSDLLSKHRPR